MPELSAHTTVDDAHVYLGFTTGADGAGNSFFASDLNLDRGESFDLDRAKPSGQGTLLYDRPGGKVASVTFGFRGAGASECRANGVATGG